jgi:hypothetical protein
MVWELEGPMPILKISNMLRNMTRLLRLLRRNLAGFFKTETVKATESKVVCPKAGNIYVEIPILGEFTLVVRGNTIYTCVIHYRFIGE